jgi:hypothetical protein
MRKSHANTLWPLKKSVRPQSITAACHISAEIFILYPSQVGKFQKAALNSDSRKQRGKKVNKLSFSSIVVTLAMGLL